MFIVLFYVERFSSLLFFFRFFRLGFVFNREGSLAFLPHFIPLFRLISVSLTQNNRLSPFSRPLLLKTVLQTSIRVRWQKNISPLARREKECQERKSVMFYTEKY